ncbi:MAG: GntR family transcriptional regulator [Propionibacterium sp.]|nr:GntR family transcriptional regulator [Propionibacterium sp.]
MGFDTTSPLWIQLVDRLQTSVVAGQWAPGQKIPSVRELAVEFGVNPNTVQRALSELDRLGLTATERTSGRFVTADRQQVAQQRFRLATGAVDGAIDVLAGLGLDRDTAIELFGSRWDDIQKEEK